MMSSLKLPLRIVANAINGFNFYIMDGCSQPIELTKHQGEVIVAALEADAEEEAVVIPSVDYTKIPQTYEGSWVLIDIKNQRVVSAASTPENAMEGFDPADSNLVLTKVPTHEANTEKGEQGG